MSLNPCCSGRWSFCLTKDLRQRTKGGPFKPSSFSSSVLQSLVLCPPIILVVVEDGLGGAVARPVWESEMSLNPCCSGRWSRSCRQKKDIVIIVEVLILVVVEDGLGARSTWCLVWWNRSLNPCCSGRWSRRAGQPQIKDWFTDVLILVVVEDGLGEALKH